MGADFLGEVVLELGGRGEGGGLVRLLGEGGGPFQGKGHCKAGRWGSKGFSPDLWGPWPFLEPRSGQSRAQQRSEAGSGEQVHAAGHRRPSPWAGQALGAMPSLARRRQSHGSRRPSGLVS